MRGKYKQKRLQKKCQQAFKYWLSHPDKYFEDFYDIKLYWCQKLILKMMLKVGGIKH